MKRITSLLLTAAMMAGLAATPTLANEVAGSGTLPQAVVQLSEQLSAAAEKEDAPAAEAPAAEVTAQPAAEKTEKEEEKKPQLKFADLSDTIQAYNYTVISLQYQLDEIKKADLSSMKEMMEGFGDIGDSIASAKTGLDQTISRMDGMAIKDENVISTLKDISKVLGEVSGMVGMLDGYLVGQIESTELSMKQGELAIHNGIDQIVKGAEALYVGIVTMEAAVEDIQRGISTLDRAVALFEKQYELGMASAYDVESMKYQRSSVVSQLESLNFQILTSKIMLEGLCGLEITGEIRLGALTMPTREELDGVDYKKTIDRAQQKNLDVLNAELAYEYSPTLTNHYAHDAAVTSFAYNYRIVCLTVGEKERLLNAAKETVAFQERTFAIEAKEYELGMISYEEYMTAKSNLEQAESDCFRAQLDLFTAYRNFLWARDHGIV